MSKLHKQYIVYAPTFSPNNGGAIFLHNLVHVLNEIGHTALIWPMSPVYKSGLRNRLKSWLKSSNFTVDPTLDTPLATRHDLTNDTIVVYPEITMGNPLHARNVVRWLLYPPGKINPYEFGEDEMFFRVGEICDVPQITGGAPDLLLWRVNRSYRNENRPDRRGVCYIVRKGRDKPRVEQTETPDAICVDGMSHIEMNDVFNQCEIFISYDEATMYSQYAAICGCTSIVIPGLYASRDEWVAEHELARFGVAYGFNDISHAVTTQEKVLPLLEKQERKGKETVYNFVALTQERFCSTKMIG